MENSNEILNELRIEVAKQKENIDSLRTNVDKFENKLNELTSLAFMGKNRLHSVRLLKINKRGE